VTIPHPISVLNLARGYTKHLTTSDEARAGWQFGSSGQLDIILVLAAKEGLPYVHQLVRHVCGVLWDEDSWLRERYASFILDYDFLKDLSWSLAKVVDYCGVTTNLADVTSFPLTVMEEFQALREFVHTHVEELRTRHAKDGNFYSLEWPFKLEPQRRRLAMNDAGATCTLIPVCQSYSPSYTAKFIAEISQN
jgi:hypothetical protein